jgi:WD40 repeat protein
VAVVLVVAVILVVVFVVGSGDSSSEGGSGNGWTVLGEPLNGPEGNDNARFGHSIKLARNGTFLAVGLPGSDQGDGISRNISVGQAHVYAFQDATSSYEILGQPIEGPGPGAEAGKAIAMSTEPLRVAVASPKWRGGVISVYEAPSDGQGAWVAVGETLDGGEEANGEFGFCVDISGDGSVLIAGSPFANNGTGLVRIFEELNGSWSQLGETFVGRESDVAGYSVAISANGLRVAIGAIGSSLDLPGQVQVLQYNGTTWEPLGVPIDGENAQDRFGHSVALSDDGFTLAVGASGGISAGNFVRVYRYSQEEDAWVAQGSTLLSSTATDDFGFSVSLSSDGFVLAVGSPGSQDFGDDSGKISVFQFDGIDWKPLGGDIGGNAGDSLGHEVSLAGNGRQVAGGSPTANLDGRPNDVGKAAVYNRVEAGR